MFKFFAIPIAAFLVLVIGLSIYLSPNDLSGCEKYPSNEKGCEKADAIIAVSGGDTVARAQSAIILYKNGWADNLVFSGAALDKSGPSNALAMKRQAIAEGVPENAILIEEDSATTEENAKNSSSLLKGNQIEDAILVTSPYHQRRAALQFAKAAPDIKVRNHPATDSQWAKWWWMTPRGWWLATSETVKIIAFYVGGGA